ncbi:MAG: hypothetical protein ABR992_19275 [Solirubrobacteraceae bacterium]|jgi:hypothetical protein
MMRRPLTRLILLVTCGVLVLGGGLFAAIEASAGAAVKRGAAASVGRSWPVSMSAAPNDLTLAEASFREPRKGRRISGSSLRVSVGSPFGDDYLAAAALRSPTQGILRVLVVLVNRPSPLLDPVSVSVSLTAPRELGAPLVLKSIDPLSRSASARMPAVCDLALHGDALSASELLTLRSRGQALAGFSGASAVAQAYDLGCGLPHSSSFARAVVSSPVSESNPPVPSPVPSPTPPVGKLPGEGCVPTPGYACPAAFDGRPRAAVVAG